MAHAREIADRIGADRAAFTMFAGSAPGPRHRGVVRGCDPELVRLGDMVETVGQGSAHEVLVTGEPVVVDDVHAGDQRWPALTGAFDLPAALHDRGVTMLDYDVEVLNSGAGPVGLTAAMRLARWGVPVRLEDAAAGRSVVPAALEEQRGTGSKRISPGARPLITVRGTAVRTIAGQVALR